MGGHPEDAERSRDGRHWYSIRRLRYGLTVSVNGEEISLDTRKPKGITLVSHAHFDHSLSLGERGEKYTTPGTLSYFSALREPYGEIKTLKIGSKIKMDDVEIGFLESGHIFHSSQFLMDFGDISILYTGDLNPKGGLLAEPAEREECDILIIDSTYGSPKYVFPEREEIEEEIRNWVEEEVRRGKIPVLGVYTIGKAQEITKLLCETQLTVIVHPRINKVNSKLEEEFSLNLGDYLSSGNIEAIKIIEDGEFVLLVPPNLGHRAIRKLEEMSGRKASYRRVSGWEIFGEGFPLSDHGDFPSLMEFVSDISPRLVYTVFGHSQRFAKEIKRTLGIEARGLP